MGLIAKDIVRLNKRLAKVCWTTLWLKNAVQSEAQMRENRRVRETEVGHARPPAKLLCNGAASPKQGKARQRCQSKLYLQIKAELGKVTVAGADPSLRLDCR